MSGLLQRLAVQAQGSQASGAVRIRPSSSVHAQVPMSQLPEHEARPHLRQLSQHFSAAAPVIHEATRASQPARYDHASAPPAVLVPGQARISTPSRSTPVATPPTLAEPREPTHERNAENFLDRSPPPLLDEVQAPAAPPVITPAAPPALPVIANPHNSTSEPTEVHVHIGRIEVIAAPEPAAPKKNRATPARNTLPLAEYLARRRPS